VLLQGVKEGSFNRQEGRRGLVYTDTSPIPQGPYDLPLDHQLPEGPLRVDKRADLQTPSLIYVGDYQKNSVIEMPTSWKKALDSYSYPVNLGDYKRASEFPGFFKRKISGNRKSTIEFEDYYRKNAPHRVEVFFEVMYWKLYSLPSKRDRQTETLIRQIREREVTPDKLWESIQRFVENPSKTNLEEIREKLGLSSRVLAVPLTFVAFADPQRFPMIDTHVARWVNSNCASHNVNRKNKLSPFTTLKKYTSLQDNDFPNYLNWVNWCREAAEVLTELTGEKWRARDVEMAVFTAQRNKMELNVLP